MLTRPLQIIKSWPLGSSLALLGLGLSLAALILAWMPQESKPVRYSLPQISMKAGFPKWSGVQERAWARDAEAGVLCDQRLGRPCSLTTWERFLDTLRDAPFQDRIAAVNAFVNRTGYHEDQALWGASDYWAAPGEFFARGGDCEDYAIAKYYSLRALGVPDERMRIVVLQDTRRQIPHAVLTVRWAGPDLVLDNLSDDVRVWPELAHYQPIYSINETSYDIVRSPMLPALLQSAGS